MILKKTIGKKALCKYLSNQKNQKINKYLNIIFENTI